MNSDFYILLFFEDDEFKWAQVLAKKVFHKIALAESL